MNTAIPYIYSVPVTNIAICHPSHQQQVYHGLEYFHTFAASSMSGPDSEDVFSIATEEKFDAWQSSGAHTNRVLHRAAEVENVDDNVRKI